MILIKPSTMIEFITPDALALIERASTNLLQESLWRHFFKLRTAPAAHPQMRELTIPLLGKFQALVPIVFDGLGD